MPQVPIETHKLRPAFTALGRQSIGGVECSRDSGFDFVSSGLKHQPASARLFQLGFEIAALEKLQESGNQLRSGVLGNLFVKAFAEIVYVKYRQSVGVGRYSIEEEEFKVISGQLPSSDIGSGWQTVAR